MVFGFGRPRPPSAPSRPETSAGADTDAPPVGSFRASEGEPPSLDSAEALLARARAGDADALGRLLGRYQRYLLLLARLQIGKRLQVKIEPNDLIQETFLEASAHFDRFAGSSEGEFLVWLRRIFAGILCNQVRRYFGTKRRDVRLERRLVMDLDRSSLDLDRNFIASQSSPSRDVSRREQSVVLADALNELPEDYREVIILRQLEDLPFSEVAARMGRTENSVKNLWARALARLRREMEDPR